MKWQIWSEGYSITGNEGGSQLLGEVEADFFPEACAIWAQSSGDPSLFDLARLTYWGCRLFSNKADASGRFG